MHLPSSEIIHYSTDAILRKNKTIIILLRLIYECHWLIKFQVSMTGAGYLFRFIYYIGGAWYQLKKLKLSNNCKHIGAYIITPICN